MRALFRTMNGTLNWQPSWNIAPSQAALVVRRHPQTGERHLDARRWGLVPHFTTDPKGGRKPSNARADTVATVGIFCGAFAARRCLVPASAFYEWMTLPAGKQPYAFARQDGEPIALGWLWEGWRAPDGETVRTSCLITTAANAIVVPIHDRMLVIFKLVDGSAWLGETGGDPTELLWLAP